MCVSNKINKKLVLSRYTSINLNRFRLPYDEKYNCKTDMDVINFYLSLKVDLEIELKKY